MKGISTIINIGGFGKAISHARCSKLRHANHAEVIFSKHQIKAPFGRYKSSKKKIRDEISRKQVKNGPKMRVLIGLKSETGRPQAMRNGSEIKDIKSCSWMLLSNDFLQRS